MEKNLFSSIIDTINLFPLLQLHDNKVLNLKYIKGKIMLLEQSHLLR